MDTKKEFIESVIEELFFLEKKDRDKVCDLLYLKLREYDICRNTREIIPFIDSNYKIINKFLSIKLLEGKSENEQEHAGGHGEGNIDVRRRHHAKIRDAYGGGDGRQQINRQQIHQIHQKDPHKHGQGQRGNQSAFALENGGYRTLHKLKDHLYKALQLGRNAGSGA